MDYRSMLVLPAILVAPLALGSACAQTVLYALTSPDPAFSGQFGYSVSGTPDVNGDGYHDFLVGAYFEDGPGTRSGSAYVFDGRTGSPFHIMASPNPEYLGYFGRAVSGAGDVDGDGYDDVIVGAWGESAGGCDLAGRAYVFSGDGGDVLLVLESPAPHELDLFGYAVSPGGDIDGDGCEEVLVGAPGREGGAQNSGRVYVFDGSDGALLDTLDSPDPFSGGDFGCSVSAVGDVDGDGRGDFVVGAHWESDGAAHVFSGAGWGLLYSLHPPAGYDEPNFGGSVAGAGDVNADGYDDIVVGAFNPDAGVVGDGAGYVFSGSDGVLLAALESQDPEWDGGFGRSVAGLGDVDGDGCSDVAVGAWGEDAGAWGAGRVYVFSGGTGDLLCSLESSNPASYGCFGWSVSGVGDANDDGRPDILVGARCEPGGPSEAGRAYVIALPVGIFADSEPDRPAAHAPILVGPFPNPATGAVRLLVGIPESGRWDVELGLYDVAGRLLASPLREAACGAQNVEVCWRSGGRETPGLYWWCLTVNGQQIHRPMILVR
jgi:hypothetical protein